MIIRSRSSSSSLLLLLVLDSGRLLNPVEDEGRARARGGHPSSLVHEAWLKLVGEQTDWKDRHHFIRAAAEAMRRILVDRSRARPQPATRNRQKRQGSHEHIPLEGLDIAAEFSPPLPPLPPLKLKRRA